VLIVAWIFPDGWAEAARAYLATAVQAPVDRLPPSQLMRQLTVADAGQRLEELIEGEGQAQHRAGVDGARPRLPRRYWQKPTLG
jgi:hypothetical protein